MPPPNRREAVLAALEALAVAERTRGNAFKARAYTRVLDQVRAREGPIRGWEDLAGVSGVGESIRTTLDELFETGHSAAAAATEADTASAQTFLDIYGVGPAKARALMGAGLTSMAELERALADDPALLNAKQKIGLRYVADLKKRIPRAEMQAHERWMRGHATHAQNHAPTGLGMEVVGSYRRGAENSGDIDVLVRALPKAAWEALLDGWIAGGYIVETLARGPKKFMGIVRLPNSPARRLDVLCTPEAEYPYALLYFTGSDQFNVKMRAHALTRGYTLNEHGLALAKQLRDDVLALPAVPAMADEKAIFDFLEWPWVEPGSRM